MSQVNSVQYDENFIMTSNGYYAEVEALRMARSALDSKYSELSLKRQAALMAHDDLAEVNRNIVEVQMARRDINDKIDEALQKHLGYIHTNTHHRNMVG
jgi:hypothetical protein